MMIRGWICALVLYLLPVVACAAELKITQIVEERMTDDTLAVVIPQSSEMICRTGSSPWDFAFAGMETTWPKDQPIELEVTGSGDFETKDMFSMASISLDFGSKNGGYSERALWGLGKLQPTRPPHPPSWGAGANGKKVIEGELVTASEKPARVAIDVAKAAPKGWDGRVWITLHLHNVGAKKFLKVKILNASANAPEPEESKQWKLVSQHQKQFLEHAVQTLDRATPQLAPAAFPPVVPELKAFADTQTQPTQRLVVMSHLQDALKHYDQSPLGAEGFFKLAESYFTVLHSDEHPQNRAAELNQFGQSWKDAGSLGRDINCIIRVASSLEKVYLHDVRSGRMIGANAEPIQLSAARNEYESFQLVLTPINQTRESVQVSLSNLTDDTGHSLDPAKINAVGYVRIFPGQPRETLVPDPLLAGPIPELAPGENQPVWIAVHVPADANPGMYRGSLSISSTGKAVRIPVELRVRNFSIPKRISLRSSFWMFRDQINRFYHLKEVSLDDYLKWIGLALEHRLNPIDVYEGRCSQLVDIIHQAEPTTKPAGSLAGTPNPHPDFSKCDRYIEFMLDHGANTIHLGQTHHEGSMFASDPKQISTAPQVENVVKALEVLKKHFEEKGWMRYHYLQLRDETSAPDSLNVYRAVKKRIPDLKLLLTAPSAEAKPLLDIPCPLTPGFDAKWRDEVHKKGGEYWWYVCVSPRDPAWANFFLEQEAPQHRALFWQTWSHDVDGLLYWGMDFWSWYGYQWPKDAKGPTKRVPAKDDPNFASLPDCPGDGFSMYPGADPAHPLSSVRLEIMRDGEEDFEYLKLLDQLIAKNPEGANEAKNLEAEIRRTFDNMTLYPLDGQVYLNLRSRIADEIESLNK